MPSTHTPAATSPVYLIKFTLQATQQMLTGRSIDREVAVLANLTGEAPKAIENALRANLMTSGLQGHVEGILARAESLQEALDARDEEDAARADYQRGLEARVASLAAELDRRIAAGAAPAPASAPKAKKH
jgi:hypothetical protein